MDSLSAAQEAYFRTRDKAERLHQKAASLNRVLKNNIERCEKKLGLQMNALSDSERMEEYRVKGELLTASLLPGGKGREGGDAAQLLRSGLAASWTSSWIAKLSPAARTPSAISSSIRRRAPPAAWPPSRTERTEEELDYLEGQLDNLGKCAEEAELFELSKRAGARGLCQADRAAAAR